eukprot:COSAG06_NODE_3439_length_5348_cov_4.151457_5_plen_125_part_00
MLLVLLTLLVLPLFAVSVELPRGPDPLPPTPPVEGAPRPHIVLFVVDDYGWANLGAHSASPGLTHTPNFDAAVAEGVLLERHYTFFWCAPTRAAFLTGRMPYAINPPSVLRSSCATQCENLAQL